MFNNVIGVKYICVNYVKNSIKSSEGVEIMNVFSKYLLKSMAEKKGRTFLLLMAIAVSVSLLVASMGSVKAFLGTITTQVKGNFGDFNVMITPNKSLEVPLFNVSDINDPSIKESHKSLSIGGYLSSDDKKEFSLVGTSLSDFNKFNSIQIIKKDNLEPFEGKKIIISQKTSDNLKAQLGDEIKLNILGKEDIYKVAAIATNKAMFFSDTEKNFSFVTPEENLFSIFGEKGKYSVMFASVDSKDLKAWVKDFNEKNKDKKIVASEIFDEKAIEQQLNMLKMPLYFMLAIVLLMTTFIIYSSFKLIITERLPIIGTFLSQGATKGGIIKILLKESLAYGILGGVIGDLIGGGLTYLVAYLANPLKEYGVKATTEFYVPYFITGFIFAVILSLASSMLPIIAIRKLPVKDVILNTLGTSNKISLKSFIVGIVFIICSAILHILGAKINYKASLPSLFLAFIGVMLIIPKVVDTVFYPLVRLLRNISGLSMLSFNNVRTSKVLINNIRLIAVSVISIVMITSIRASLLDIVKGAYDGMKYDVSIQVNSNNKKIVDEVVNKYDKASTINEWGFIMAKLDGDTSKDMLVWYADPEKYKTFENYVEFDDKKKELDDLNKNEDGIILSKQMAVRYNLKQGDTITLTTDDKKEQFKVLSIANAKMMNGGNYNLISKKAALKHFDIKYPSYYFISTTVSQTDAKNDLEKSLKGLGASVSTKDEQLKSNEENNKMIVNILGIFSYITMVVGAFGILSNVSISFLQRKREMAVISSVGLTKGGRGYMILLEGIFQALIGTVISLAAAYGINILLEDIFKFLTLDMKLMYPYESIGTIMLATIILMIITSLSSIFRSKKLQIVNELKYE